MLQSGANVIIWCYHVMLSSGMITPPFFIFPENFTHSKMCTGPTAFHAWRGGQELRPVLPVRSERPLFCGQQVHHAQQVPGQSSSRTAHYGGELLRAQREQAQPALPLSGKFFKIFVVIHCKKGYCFNHPLPGCINQTLPGRE
jgi:hypothetical protein